MVSMLCFVLILFLFMIFFFVLFFYLFFFFFQAEDGIRDRDVTGVQTCALPIFPRSGSSSRLLRPATESRPSSYRSRSQRAGRPRRSPGPRARASARSHLR